MSRWLLLSRWLTLWLFKQVLPVAVVPIVMLMAIVSATNKEKCYL